MAARLSLLLSLIALSGCALLPPAQLQGTACLRQFHSVDARIEAADARDHAAHRPAGFPWLRSTRFLASFADELISETQRAVWLERLRAEDMAARQAELRNAGIDSRELAWLDSCGEHLNAALLADEQALKRLRAAATVPDDYSLVQRFLGFYPLAQPLLRWQIADYQAKVLSDYRQPLSSLAPAGPLTLWKIADKSSVGSLLSLTSADALGIPRLTDAQWRALAEQHAPAWWIESTGSYDRPGRPYLSVSGPAVNTDRPEVYFQPGYARWQGRVLVQLAYVIWFDERPPRAGFDPYAGRLDGLIWRVTLDEQGQPLTYDSIHSCGCYYQLFPVQDFQPQRGPEGEEPLLLPQAQIPEEPLALRLQSGTHFLRRVVAQSGLRSDQALYELRPYVELRSLAAGQGGYRSLFGPGGLVAGTERGERWWLWPSGVPSPGAMRQWGRHAIAFVGMRHFDDPFLAEELFYAE